MEASEKTVRLLGIWKKAMGAWACVAVCWERIVRFGIYNWGGYFNLREGAKCLP
jgi:hypothetical protein